MKTMEALRRHPWISVGTALALGVSAIETVGFFQNHNYSAPEGSCTSPVAVSGTYVDHGTNTWLQTYTGMLTTGVVARGTVPRDALGVEATFKSPTADADAWNEHASRMIKPNPAGEFTLKMAIGSGEVLFGVRVVAPEGSPLCTTPPEVDYRHEDRKGYYTTSGTLPWPNPVNLLPNTVHP